MTLFLFVLIASIGLPIQAFFNYKVTADFSKYGFIKNMDFSFSLAFLSFLEYSYFNTLYMAIVFSTVMAFIVFKILVYFGIMVYVLSGDKVEGDNLSVVKLFLKTLKVRNFHLSKNKTELYFVNNDGVNIYFGNPYTEFPALCSDHVNHFNKNLIGNTLKHVYMHNFLILNVNNDYISLSSEELSMLDVRVDKITKRHFEIAKMMKI